jgi:hypothetical protein
MPGDMLTKDEMITETSDWRRFFSLTYWRIQLAFILRGGYPLNVVSVITVELPDSELARWATTDPKE